VTVYALCSGCGYSFVGDRLPDDWPCRRTPNCYPTTHDASSAGRRTEITRLSGILADLRARLRTWQPDDATELAYRDLLVWLDRRETRR
jgi:hypothetical protein